MVLISILQAISTLFSLYELVVVVGELNGILWEVLKGSKSFFFL